VRGADRARAPHRRAVPHPGAGADEPAVLETLLERPLGNHLLLIRGHRAALVCESHRLLHRAGPASAAG